MERPKVLLLSSDFSRFEQVAAVLARENIEVHRMMRAEAALKLAGRLVFRTILVADPVEDMGMPDLLKAIRADSSPSRGSGVILLIPPTAMAEQEKLIERGANRVLSLACDGGELRQALGDLLGVAIRAKLRTMLQIELVIGTAKRRVICQTDNISASGFLVRGNPPPIGSQFSFELKLPGQPAPIRGTAEVVRHAKWVREKIQGFGARFVTLAGGGRQILDAYLARNPG